MGSVRHFRAVADVRTGQARSAEADEAEAKAARRALDAEVEISYETEGTELVGVDGRAIPEEVAGDFAVLHWAIRAKQLGKLYELEANLDEIDAPTPHQKMGVAREKLKVITEQNRMLGVDRAPVIERRKVREEEATRDSEEEESTLVALQRRASEIQTAATGHEQMLVDRADKEERVREVDAERDSLIQQEMAARKLGKAARDDAADEQSITESDGAWWENIKGQDDE